MIDWERIRERKNAYRESRAALPFDVKLGILERIRERGQVLRGRTGPANALERTGTSQVCITILHMGTESQQLHGTIHPGPLSANATLIMAVPLQTATATRHSEEIEPIRWVRKP